ncbi:hypothetical protein L1987_48273 [Smallanthus sonchifolius]|uniref:Uncharacterized protein n=1 Tax=Smallanthus sonchifolius TaxID=185202 RepID=A0ACB9FT54_9ASTR|nr:hypothetical protein L1987_48273 [Smallanthus sonchifolius]
MFDKVDALVMVLDLNNLSSFSELKKWVSCNNIEDFDILLCIGNKANLLPGHSTHVKYGSRLLNLDESSDYGISVIEGNYLLRDEESSSEIKRLKDNKDLIDAFKVHQNFSENEKPYEDFKKTILDDESLEGDEDHDHDYDYEEEVRMKITDETETHIVDLRRTIYLTIMNSLDYEEAGHKLLKIKLDPGQEMEICVMLIECCMQEKTYRRFYGLLGEKLCVKNKVYKGNLEECFVQRYAMVNRVQTNSLRNLANFFAHLLGTGGLSWQVLCYIRLTEEDTTSSSRIFC